MSVALSFLAVALLVVVLASEWVRIRRSSAPQPPTPPRGFKFARRVRPGDSLSLDGHGPVVVSTVLFLRSGEVVIAADARQPDRKVYAHPLPPDALVRVHQQ